MVCKLRIQVLSMAILFSKGQRSGLFKMLQFSIQEQLNRCVKCLRPLSTKQSFPEGIQDGYSFALRLYHARSGMKSCLQKGLALWKVSSLQFIWDDKFIGWKSISGDSDQNDAYNPDLYNFIVMATQFNGSSYYRANPYYQQGYIPDSAFKNRKPPYQLGQIPQGEQFFEPTNKKHFQRLGYYSTIAEQKIIHSDEANNISSPAKEKEYFRSLNINDIQGATTNTLISKGVKNRMKAQEELNRRVQQQKESQAYERMRQLEKMEDERKRMEALNILKKKSEPNYHQLTKRMRTQEKQKLAVKIQQTQIDRIESDRNQASNAKFASKDPIHAYQAQLQQAQKQIKQLQMQLSQVKSQKERAQYDYESRVKQQLSSSRQDNLNIAPITNEKKQYYPNQNAYHQQQPSEENPELYYNSSPYDKLQLSPEQRQYLVSQRQAQENTYRNGSNQGNAIDIPINEKRAIERVESRNERMQPVQSLSGRQHRQQHRRFNPTFLSYGSASISLAGKNIVGY